MAGNCDSDITVQTAAMEITMASLFYCRVVFNFP